MPVLFKRYTQHGNAWALLLIFCYAFFSDFTRFGFFLILAASAYYVCQQIFYKRSLSRGLIATGVLFLGYAVTEYRLFYLVLFSGIETIRSRELVPFFEGLKSEIKQLLYGQCHFFSMAPQKFIYPLLFLFFPWLLKNAQARKLLLYFLLVVTAQFCLFFMVNILNISIFTVRFYTFIPILLLSLLLILSIVISKKISFASSIFIIIIQICISQPSWPYNMIYVNYMTFIKKIYNNKYDPWYLSFREYFSAELFKKIKKDINYKGEYAVAVLLDPSILAFNGISTLDGYANNYSKRYKESFRKVISPELSENELVRKYYDEWGARAYIFTDDWNIHRNSTFYSKDNKIPSIFLRIDPVAFAELDGKYIFSRVPIENFQELSFLYLGAWSTDESPYTIHIYKNKTASNGKPQPL